MSTPRPRRCSARWLDGDCPAGVLAIIDDPSYHDRFTVIYTDVLGTGADASLVYLALTESGSGYHGELKTYEAAAYRYRAKHRYAKWSTLPEAVKAAVRADLTITY